MNRQRLVVCLASSMIAAFAVPSVARADDSPDEVRRVILPATNYLGSRESRACYRQCLGVYTTCRAQADKNACGWMNSECLRTCGMSDAEEEPAPRARAAAKRPSCKTDKDCPEGLDCSADQTCKARDAK